MNRNMRAKIHRSATPYGVRNSIPDTLRNSHFAGNFADGGFGKCQLSLSTNPQLRLSTNPHEPRHSNNWSALSLG